MTVDCFDTEQRSRVMKAVHRHDTAPELRLRRRLWKNGLRYRKHPRIANTRPDFAFLRPRMAVFVDGCFWHGCPRHYVAPVGNAAFWRDKLQRNQALDRRVTERLEDDGWMVLRVWECDVNKRLDAVILHIHRLLKERGGFRFPAGDATCLAR